MPSIKNIIIPGSGNLPITLDIFFQHDREQKPIVIYAHGFNGFKDWGNFDLISEKFSAAGFVFVKFNFSHNGTTAEEPEIFTNLEAFGNNNYSRQLEDIKKVVDWVCDYGTGYLNENANLFMPSMMDCDQIYLIGHSMGGGTAILYAAADKRIKKLVTWASISECKTPWGSWDSEKMKGWKDTGVAYYHNNRTKQQMPLYYQLYEDYVENQEKLDIKNAIGKLNIPILICHGKADNAVPVEKAYLLNDWQPSAQLFITDGDHVFGRIHPWIEHKLPQEMETVVDASILFLKG